MANRASYANLAIRGSLELPFAYVEDRIITSLVTYYKDESGGVYATVYSLTEGVPNDILRSSNPHLGDDVLELRATGQLFRFDGDLAKLTDLYRIDDDRAGRNLSYLVWLTQPDAELPVPSFAPGAIYGFYPDGVKDPKQEGNFPNSLTREELQAMMTEVGIRPITSTQDLPGNPAPGSILKNTGGLRVWDLGAMYRS